MNKDMETSLCSYISSRGDSFFLEIPRDDILDIRKKLIRENPVLKQEEIIYPCRIYGLKVKVTFYE